MGSFGGYYKGEKRKKKKDVLEEKASHPVRAHSVPQVEIVGRSKKGK